MSSNAWRVETDKARFGCSSRPVAYEIVASVTSLGAPVTVYHFEDDRWVLYERVEAGTPSLVAADARWQALRDWLTEQCAHDKQVMESYANYADGGVTSRAHGAMLSAKRTTLAKMAELEAGQ